MKFNDFLNDNKTNALLYAPTQLGKTMATIDLIKCCFLNDIPVIVSTDNKLDQQVQLMDRVKPHFTDTAFLKANDLSSLKDYVQTKNHKFIVFCLDNFHQIKKVAAACSTHHFPKIAIIHDEADIITKDQLDKTKKDLPKSHQEWLTFIDTVKSMVQLKRIFVTATPENCVMLYPIDCSNVFSIKKTQSYVGYESITHYPFKPSSVFGDLAEEVNRIKAAKTYEAILYCVERKIEKGQAPVFDQVINLKLDCVIHLYNGNGITVYLPNSTLVKKFKPLISDYSYTYNKNIFVVKKLSIKKFYSMVKAIGERCVITIGRDLICRGISFVGQDSTSPITATVMFYKPGPTCHTVAICQTVGRITGCAMPELPRRLYCPQDVYKSYISYNRNQELYINTFKTTTGLTANVISKLKFQKYTRNIDKAKLNLQFVTEDDQ